MVRRRNKGGSSMPMDRKVEETAVTATASTSMPMNHKVEETSTVAPAPNQNKEFDVSETQQLLGNAVTLMEKLSIQLERWTVESEKDWSLKQIRDFKRLNPPTFDGMHDPIMAKKWLREIKKTLDILSITGARSVELATFQLKGQADDWWASIKKDKDFTTWEELEELFLANYFAESAKDQIMTDFHRLDQRNMTVAEYASKFVELSQFVPYIVDDEYLKIRRFQNGLKMNIRERLASFMSPKLIEVVQRAAAIERELGELETISPIMEQITRLPNSFKATVQQVQRKLS